MPAWIPVVHVYAPAGDDLDEHLKRIERFNTRADQPTHWLEKVYTGRLPGRPRSARHARRQEAGQSCVVLSGNNARKTDYICSSVEAGLNVLADKPMAITPGGSRAAASRRSPAAAKRVLLYDIMTERFEITTDACSGSCRGNRRCSANS